MVYIYFIIELFSQKSNFLFYFSQKNNPIYKTFSLNEKDFNLFLTIENKNKQIEINYTNYKVYAVNGTKLDENSKINIDNYFHWVYEKCDYSDIFSKNISKEQFLNSLCIKSCYNPNKKKHYRIGDENYPIL